MMEQDQIKKLSIEFRIVKFLASREEIKTNSELKELLEKFYLNFKVLKQKKEVSDEEFLQFLRTCLDKK